MEFFFEHGQQFFLMLGLLVLSGLFSGTETAIFSLRVSDINRIRQHPDAIGNIILALRDDLSDFLMTVLLSNLLVNIFFFSLSTTLAGALAADPDYGHGAGVAFGLCCLFLVIIAGEVTPKSIATVARRPFCRLTAAPMLVLHRLTRPARYVLGAIVRAAERLADIRATSLELQAEELKMLIQLSREEGVLSAREQEFLDEVVDLPEIRIREVMTPRVDFVTVSPDATPDELVEMARNTSHSKILLRDPETDEAIGWIDAREVFLGAETSTVAPFVRPPAFVSEFDRADAVLRRFGEEKRKLFVVVDERGGTAGLVTPSDILSEIFGEFGDEDEHPDEPVREEGKNTYRLDGQVSVREWRGLFRVGGKLPHVATVGGLVTSLLGHPPGVGDRVELGNIRMEVLAVHRRRVAEIRLTLNEPEAEKGGGAP